MTLKARNEMTEKSRTYQQAHGSAKKYREKNKENETDVERS